MKLTLTGIVFLIIQLAFAQSYEEQTAKAAEALQKKDFCNALGYFKTAFKDTAKIGTYDFAYAALAAANCNDEKQALVWLAKSQQKGLGLNPGEADAIANDSGFVKLHKYPDWTSFVSLMRQALANKQTLQKKQSDDWVAAITGNKIKPGQKGKFSKANPGFALYNSKANNLEVPYLVYVPKAYNPAKPTKAVIYLHGGIVNTENFNFQDPEVGKGEPIFSIGDAYNAIIIYPFGKRDFGWVKQEAAFQNVLTIINNVKSAYNLDSKNIFIGGMSNGGTATFWFASQKPNMFRGFYAFSALPKLEIGNIRFENFSQNKPFYSVNAKDDDVFKFDEVDKIYNDSKTIAKDWQLDTVQTGGHGFIYQPNGREVFDNTFKKLLSK